MLHATTKFLSIMTFSMGLTGAAIANPKPVLNDWFALGSGCRAKSDLPGNVRMEQIDSGSEKDLHRVKFYFTDFALEGSKSNLANKKFGRECAVRLNINPPAGKRLVGLRAVTAVQANKDAGPSLDVVSELKLGSVSLISDEQKLSSKDKISKKNVEVDLRSAKANSSVFPNLECGEPKIIGFDYSWIVSREKSKSQKIEVSLAGDKTLVIEAKLEDCKM